MEIEGNDPRIFFFNIIEDRKLTIFDPLHSQMYDLGGNVLTLEKSANPSSPIGRKLIQKN